MENVTGYSGISYNTSNTVRIVNMAQAAAYWANGIAPLDIYPSRDYKTNKPIMVCVFDKLASSAYYDLWSQHKLM